MQQVSNETFGVVHMSDIHLDPRQVDFDGSTLASTNDKFWDRYEVTTSKPRWGAYGDDSPGDLILSAFSTVQNLVDMNNIDFTVFTGDVVNHGSDDSLSEEYVMFEKQTVFRAFEVEMRNAKGEIVSILTQTDFMSSRHLK